jgi:hypothetical protein
MKVVGADSRDAIGKPQTWYAFSVGDYTRATGHSEVIHIDGETATRRNIPGRHEIPRSKTFSLATPSTAAHFRFADHLLRPFDPLRSTYPVDLSASDYAISLYPITQSTTMTVCHRNCQNFYASFLGGAVLPLEANGR